MVTNIPQVGRTQHGITNGMNQHIRIAMSQEAQRMLNPDASQPECSIRHQGMYIIAKTYSYLHRTLSEKVTNTIHIEGERETERLIQRVALYRTDQVGSIELEHAHAETGTH